jgi:hypothetical protein
MESRDADGNLLRTGRIELTGNGDILADGLCSVKAVIQMSTGKTNIRSRTGDVTGRAYMFLPDCVQLY